MSSIKKRDARRMVLVYTRYLLPPILCLVLVGLMLIPNLRYSTASGTQGDVSLFELLGNSWDQVRQNLFGSGEITVQEERFSWILIILIPTLVLLFAVGFLSSLAVAVYGLLYVGSPQFRRTPTRVGFVTVLPNRAVVCALQSFVLPILFYSRILIPIYKKVLRIDVLLNVDFPEAWVFGLVFLAAIIALSVWSAGYERDMGADPFKPITPPVVKVLEATIEEDTPREPVFKTDEEREYYERQKRAREEQAELIRKLLNKDEEEN